jgi:hypothetical protein
MQRALRRIKKQDQMADTLRKMLSSLQKNRQPAL